MAVDFIEATVNGRKIAYTSVTLFEVQVGYGSKGKYETRYAFHGDLPKAVKYYNAINIGGGYKKRLYMPSSKKPVIAKQSSY